MTRRTTATRRLGAITLTAALAFASVACSNDDESLPPPTTAEDVEGTEGTEPTDTSGETPTGDTLPADPLAPFSGIDDSTMNDYCDAVQAASPLTLENAPAVAEAAPPEIAAEYQVLFDAASSAGDSNTLTKAATSLFRLAKLHEDVCGIPIKFG